MSKLFRPYRVTFAQNNHVGDVSHTRLCYAWHMTRR